jgi:group I intron endonuclease
MIVYLALNKINGKMYIGVTRSTLERRVYLHLKSKSCRYFHQAIKKWGRENFEFFIIDRADNIDSLHEKERHWIALHGTNDREKGYNLTMGGEGVSGTPEVRRKIAAAKMGDGNPMKRADVRAKVSASLMGNVPWNKGKAFSDEHRRNLSESHMGNKRSAESRAKQSKSARGHRATATILARDEKGRILKSAAIAQRHPE